MTISISDETKNPLIIKAGGAIDAFNALSIADSNPLSDTETVTVSLTPSYYYSQSVGSIADPNGGGSFQNGVFTESGLIGGSPTFATTLLGRLVYDAPSLPNGQSSLVQATVSVTDAGVTQTDPTPISVDVVTPPSISGTAANQPVASGSAIRPFASTDVQDYDFTGNALDVATIIITNAGVATDADGLLTGPGLSKTGTGAYMINATSYWQLTSNLEQLSFSTPTLATGQTVTPSFGLQVTDLDANLTSNDTNTSVEIIGPIQAPTPSSIAGVQASQTVASGNSIDPFASVTITDPNANPLDSVTIIVTNASGSATDANGTFAAETGITHTGTGTYTITATSPATLTSELDKLSFSPTPLSSAQGSATTNFALTVANTAVSQPATASTSLVETQPPTPTGGTQVNSNFIVHDETTGQVYAAPGSSYTGPVAGLTNQFVLVTSDSVNVNTQVPNSFTEISFLPGQQTPPLTAGIDVSAANGNNVLDSYANSSFLTGGSGTDQFYDDVRTLTQNSWSTVVNFHSGDNLTLWGITQGDFTLDWIGDTYGAPGATGLTGVFVPTTSGQPEAAITLAGITSADLNNGKLTMGYNSIGGVNYYSIHAT